MKLKKIAVALIISLVGLFTFNLVTFAENNLIPYDGGAAGGASAAETGTKPATDAINTDLFEDVHIVKDPNVASTTKTIANVVSIVITFIISVMPVLLALQLVLDMACILLKPLAVTVARFPCCQLNSDEAIAVTGVAYTGRGEHGGGTGATAPADLKGRNPMVFYLYSRLKTVIFATVMCILIGTGLLFNLILAISNHIVSWIAGLI